MTLYSVEISGDMNLYCSVLADNTVVLKSVVHLMKGSRANETQLPLVKNLSFVSEEKHGHVFGVFGTKLF